MTRELTELEKGILVYISQENLEKVKKYYGSSGFLPTEYYPEQYKEFLLENEVGRFLMFRFILKPA